MSPTRSPRQIIIIGGGIIGCTTAYYLTQHPRFSSSGNDDDGGSTLPHITLLEASTIAAGASGKAGGLVAAWAYPRELAGPSFAEHRRLAESHDGATRWGWREVACGRWEGRAGTSARAGQCHGDGGAGAKSALLPPDLNWLDETLTDAYEALAAPGMTAQVHPREFTTSMLALARAGAGEGRLAVVEGARVVAIEREGGRVVGVTYELTETTTTGSPPSRTVHVPADTVLLAAGPWSPTLLPSLPVTSTRAHSIVLEPAAPLSPHVLFTSILAEDVDADGEGAATPEIYPRPHNRVYVCGSGDEDVPLPVLASLVQTAPAAIAALRAQVGSISAPLRDGRVEREQACYLPLGGPIVGPVEGVRGMIVATGHTCWGICNAPGTGKAVAEMIIDGKLEKEWKLSKLEPRRFLDG